MMVWDLYRSLIGLSYALKRGKKPENKQNKGNDLGGLSRKCLEIYNWNLACLSVFVVVPPKTQLRIPLTMKVDHVEP
jgi:hypothetical protein